MKQNFLNKDQNYELTAQKEKSEQKFTYFFIATRSPALLGVYDERGKLVCAREFAAPASEALPAAFAELLGVYAPRRLVYTHTPGSFMALKIAYCFFATAALALGAELAGLSAMHLAPVVRANSAAAFVGEPPRLLPLAALRQSRPEFFTPEGEFAPPKAQLPEDFAPFEPLLVPGAEPDYCVNAY